MKQRLSRLAKEYAEWPAQQDQTRAITDVEYDSYHALKNLRKAKLETSTPAPATCAVTGHSGDNHASGSA